MMAPGGSSGDSGWDTTLASARGCRQARHSRRVGRFGHKQEAHVRTREQDVRGRAHASHWAGTPSASYGKRGSFAMAMRASWCGALVGLRGVWNVRCLRAEWLGGVAGRDLDERLERDVEGGKGRSGE